MPLNRFVADGNTYTFPSTLGSYNDNFGDAVTRTTRMPGVDGGFDEYLSEPAAREIGSIRQAFTLQSDTKEGLDDLKAAVNAMLGWGKGYLYFRPSDYPTDTERRVSARISNIQMSKDESDGRNLYWQKVTCIWQCNNPIWEAGTANPATINHTGTSSGGGTTNYGNAAAIPIITVETGAGQTITTPWYIRRKSGATILDEVNYNYTLPENTLLTINCKDWSIIWDNGVTELDGYDGTFEFLYPDWFRVAPGTNVFEVVSGDSGDAATVIINYYPAWY
jgi:hypothetical protein